jgi:hypothetical protein
LLTYMMFYLVIRNSQAEAFIVGRSSLFIVGALFNFLSSLVEDSLESIWEFGLILLSI